MSKQSTDSARELRAKVTSKNGTTQAAIESFQEQNFEIIVSSLTQKYSPTEPRICSANVFCLLLTASLATIPVAPSPKWLCNAMWLYWQ
jgi:hypothetical protein